MRSGHAIDLCPVRIRPVDVQIALPPVQIALLAVQLELDAVQIGPRAVRITVSARKIEKLRNAHQLRPNPIRTLGTGLGVGGVRTLSNCEFGEKSMEDAKKKWSALAWQVEGPVDRLPQLYAVLTGEGLDVARACQRYWQPGKNPNGEVIRPGLVSAVGANLPASAPDDLVELVKALTDAQTEYRLLVGGGAAAPIDRAQFVLSEIRATLAWVFDDGAAGDQDQQLAALAEAHDAAQSQDDVAAALFEYAELGDRNRDAISGVGGFDVALIDEARALGQALREASAGPAEADKPETRVALELRNRLGNLLYDRMQKARAAIRFVFRRHPDIAREASSTYERRGRAERRRRTQEKSESAAGTPAEAGGA